MKKTNLIFLLLTIALSMALSGCAEKATAASHDYTPATKAIASGSAKAADANVWKGEIVETMSSGGYTYVLIDTGSEKIWAAAIQTTVAVGQRVTVPTGTMMANFSSKTLNRTFDKIYFVDGIYPEGAQQKVGVQAPDMVGMPQDVSHAGSSGMGGSANTVLGDAQVEVVSKPAGGYTVAEILAQSSALSGKNVKVRGRVVKFTADIMGTNWIHIQDGTQGDLTVTTDAILAKGDLVMVEGLLSVDKDIGAGYRYPAIIENAKVTKE